MVICPRCEAENGNESPACFHCGQNLKRSWWSRIFGAITGERTSVGNHPRVELEEEGSLKEAIAEYDEAIRVDPRDAAAYKNRGAVYEDLGQYQRAIEDLDQAIRLDSQFAGAYNTRASIYFKLGQYQRSVEDVDLAISLAPELAGSYAGRALAYTLLGREEEAQQDLERAVELGFDRTVIEEEIEELKKQG